MKVLITGGAGFIGSHLAEMMLVYRVQVRALDCCRQTVGGVLPSLLFHLVRPSCEFRLI